MYFIWEIFLLIFTGIYLTLKLYKITKYVFSFSINNNNKHLSFYHNNIPFHTIFLPIFYGSNHFLNHALFVHKHKNSKNEFKIIINEQINSDIFS